MICRSCRTGMLARLNQQQSMSWTTSTVRQSPIVRPQLRSYSDIIPPPSPAPCQPTAGDKSTPSATSSATPGVSQPLSTPEGVHTDAKPAAPSKPVIERQPSSCPAGTKMNGLNYFKNKPDVFAKEDSEYPDWLWDLLADSSKQSKSDKGGVDVSTLNKKQRKRYEKKLAARTGHVAPKIPAHHHADDITPASYNRDVLPEDSLAEAAAGFEKREEVTKSARQARRKSIKESNFLRGL